MPLDRHAILTCVLLCASACQPTVEALGQSPSGILHGADVMESVAVHLRREGMRDQFGPYQARLTREVMAPSRLFDDASWWTSHAGSSRVLHFGATLKGRDYVMAPHFQPAMQRVGDARYAFELTHRGDDTFEWNTIETYQIGTVKAARVLAAVRATLDAPTQAPGGALLPLLRAHFPLAAEAFGRLGVLERAEGRTLPDGSTLSTMDIRVHPDRTRAAGFPHLAKYLDRYITPLVLHAQLTDPGGHPVFTMDMEDNLLRMGWRSVGGRLVRMAGPLRAPPARWRLRFSIASHVLLWDVGARDVEAEVTAVDLPGEVGWLLRFRKVPTWDIPPGVVRLMGGSLERPFQQGIQLRMTVREDGARTVAVRRIHAVLEESMLLRWVGRLVAAISDDFVERTQAEGYRFFREGAEAYREDILELGGRTVMRTGAH